MDWYWSFLAVVTLSLAVWLVTRRRQATEPWRAELAAAWAELQSLHAIGSKGLTSAADVSALFERSLALRRRLDALQKEPHASSPELEALQTDACSLHAQLEQAATQLRDREIVQRFVDRYTRTAHALTRMSQGSPGILIKGREAPANPRDILERFEFDLQSESRGITDDSARKVLAQLEAAVSAALQRAYQLEELDAAMVPDLDPTAARARAAKASAVVDASPPIQVTDDVHFSVTAPASVAHGQTFLIDVWAHLEQQRTEVLRRAREAAQRPDLLIREKGPVRIARGTVVTVRLQVKDLRLVDPEDTILWAGDIGSASFVVEVPREASLGEKNGTATFHVGGLQIAKLHFVLTVGLAASQAHLLPLKSTRHRKAFASYASEDRDEVINIIQGIQKAVPGMDVFLDVASLRSGEKWQDRLWTEIATRDVLYLFWSLPASRSPWVEKEWRCALERRGLEFIDPVPLVAPDVAPPPRELAELHFNDWVLAYKSRKLPAPTHLQA